jgi:hypothetical protein
MSFALEIVTYIARIVKLGKIGCGYTPVPLEQYWRVQNGWHLLASGNVAIVLQGQTKLNVDF